MLSEYVKEKDLQMGFTCRSWQEAIEVAAKPLLEAGIIEERYVETIKQNHREMGAYMVVAPHIMLAHARPECGAKGLGLTFTTLAEPVPFGSELNDPVKLVITLATPDDKSHVKLLESLMQFLLQSEALAKLMAAREPSEAYDIIIQADKGED